MSKNKVQLGLAIVAVVAAAVLEYLDIDVSVVVASASAIFAGLAGYNTVNPNLRVESESETSFDCGLNNCCGDPYKCQFDRDIEEAS